MATLATETWTGTTGAAWPAQWTLSGDTGGSATIQSNRGRLTTGSGAAYKTAVETVSGMTAILDTDATVTIYPSSTAFYWNMFRIGGTGVGGSAWQPTDGYQLWLTPASGVVNVELKRYSGGTETSLIAATNTSVAWSTSVGHTIRFQRIGSIIRYKIWAATGSEPASWTGSYTDATPVTATGKVALVTVADADGAAKSTDFDNLTVTNSAATVTWGTGVEGSTSLTPSSPTGATGDLLVLIAETVNGGTLPATISGWTTSLAPTTGSQATRVAVYTKAAAGTAAETPTVSITSGASSTGVVGRVPAMSVQATTFGTDTTSAMDYSATGGSLTVADGDLLIAALSRDNDTTGASAVGLSGLTLGTATVAVERDTLLGTDSHLTVVTAGVAAAGTGAPTATATFAGSQTGQGATAFVLLRPTATADTTAPTVPTGATATANSQTQVTVSWTASTDAVGVASYRVRRGGVDLTGATAVAGTSFVDTTVVASTSYSYTISAVDAAGNRSAESSAATVTTPSYPSISTLTDTFATKDTTKWTWAANASVASGRLQLTTSATYQGIVSTGRYSLTGSQFYLEVPQTASGDTGNVDTAVSLEADSTNSLSFAKEGTLLYAQRQIAGTYTTVATLTYNATTHRWWKISESGGVVTWWTSPDGSTWTSMGTWTVSGLSLTSLLVDIQTGWFSPNTTAGAALLDNVNTLPGDTTAPTVPTGVSTTVNSATSVTVSWTASTDAVGVASYRLRRDGVDVTGATAVTGTSFTDTTAIGNTTHSYTVSAIDAAGNRSAESTAATATTPRPFATAADWLWNPIPATPGIDAASASMISAIWGTTVQTTASLYDYAAVIIDADQITSSTVPPRYDVPLAHETGGTDPDTWGPNPFGSGAYLPVSESTKLPPMHATFDAAGQNYGDAHYAVIDPIDNKIKSMWQFERTAPNTYRASWGGVTDITGDGRDTAGSATAAAFTRPAGVIRIKELAAAAAANTGLNHALFMATNQVNANFRYPAVKSDGQAGDAVPMGVRLQLDPSINVDAISGITAAEKVIAKTLQTHGVYVGDTSGDNASMIFEFDQSATRSSPTTSANTTPGSTYVSLGLTNDYFAMTHIPWGSMRALAVADGSAGPDVTAPSVPAGVTATVVSSSQINISWTASTDAVGVASYRVRRDGGDVSGATAVSGTSFAVTGLSPSTTYSFTVSAVDAAGNRSAESSAATATTPAASAPVPPPVVVVREPRRMTVSVFGSNYVRLGQVPNYVSCSVTWQYLGVGSGELVVDEDDPIAPYLLSADDEMVAVVVDIDGTRWSGRVSTVTMEREGPPGSGILTATLVDEWIWLQAMLASQNGASSTLTGMPQFDTRTGPAASVAAAYINAAASRLAVPVVATTPTSDSSATITLSARMTRLSDLLTDALRYAGVTMPASIWLPGDPQPDNIGTALTVPTVVFAPRVLADKPWLQWTDAMTNIVKLTFQAKASTAYRAILGLGGQDASRVYDQLINVTRRTAVGQYGLPEIYTDSSDTALGTPSQLAGALALAETGGEVTAAVTVADGSPFYFGEDYLVGDMATIGVSSGSWRQRVTKVTAEDTRSGGLILTSLIGEQSGIGGGDMMVQALARIAEGVRALQAGR